MSSAVHMSSAWSPVSRWSRHSAESLGEPTSTADCWNRLRDKERVEGELGLREGGAGSKTAPLGQYCNGFQVFSMDSQWI